jgi:hypothetical protein
MSGWTKEELKQMNQMREAEREEWDRSRQEWNNARFGYSETETVYVIEYLTEGGVWAGTDPFYDPISHRPGETDDEGHAHDVAAELVLGTRAVSRGAPLGGVHAVRVIRRTATATIISETHTYGFTDVPRET